MLKTESKLNTCKIARIRIPQKIQKNKLEDEDIINVLEITALREVLMCIKQGQRECPLGTLLEHIIRETMETFAMLEVKIDENTLREKILVFSWTFEDSPLF